MRRELAAPHGYYLVAVERRAAPSVDRGLRRTARSARRRQGDIQTIAVRRGIAAAAASGAGCCDALITEAGGAGPREVFLEVRADNPGARRSTGRSDSSEIGRAAAATTSPTASTRS